MVFSCFQQFSQFRYFSLSRKYWLYKVKHIVLFKHLPVFHEQLKYHNDMTFFKKTTQLYPHFTCLMKKDKWEGIITAVQSNTCCYKTMNFKILAQFISEHWTVLEQISETPVFKCRSELLPGLETEDLGVATVWNSHSQKYKLKAKAQCAAWALLTGKPMSVSCFIRRFMIQASSCLLDVFMPLVNKWEIPLMGCLPRSL